MADAITIFFDAWGTVDAKARRAKIEAATAQDFSYADPRSGGRLTGLNDVTEYITLFVDNAPGWTAKVASSDVVDQDTRTIVAFNGPGPDGTVMTQTGTYFSRTNSAGKLHEMTGFVGTGATE